MNDIGNKIIDFIIKEKLYEVVDYKISVWSKDAPDKLGEFINNSFNVCSDGHVEISYNSVSCPMCSVMLRLNDARSDIEDMKWEIKDLKRELENG